MKIDFEIKGFKLSVDAELPQPLLDLVGEVCAAARAELPGVIQSGLAKAKEQLDAAR